MKSTRTEPAKGTAERIIAAAQTVLMTAGYAQFSMRNVAAQAGLHLANVQYYFRTRDDLVRALMQDTSQRYLAAYTQVLAESPPDRHARLRAIIEFNMRDVQKPETRRYFTQMWALLDTLEPDSGPLLDEFYELDIAALSERIAEVDPGAAAAEVRRRATTLAALIEGLVVVRSAHSSSPAEMKRLMARALAIGMQIALGQLGEVES
jgi:AcrR family transcriptional regulator